MPLSTSWPYKNRPNASSWLKRPDTVDLSVSSQPLQVADTLQWATRLLTAAGVDSPRLDAELLLGQVLGCDRARLRAFWADDLSAPTARRYAALVQRRAQREPVA
ncbi:MAG: hypothetical protein GXY68_02760, partial [Chloroflexi bacterium]|nr:hypothetical protein [Chloroflexota bacterium]